MSKLEHGQKRFQRPKRKGLAASLVCMSLLSNTKHKAGTKISRRRWQIIRKKIDNQI
jgi:hypothetical protein